MEMTQLNRYFQVTPDRYFDIIMNDIFSIVSVKFRFLKVHLTSNYCGSEIVAHEGCNARRNVCFARNYEYTDEF